MKEELIAYHEHGRPLSGLGQAIAANDLCLAAARLGPGGMLPAHFVQLIQWRATSLPLAM